MCKIYPKSLLSYFCSVSLLCVFCTLSCCANSVMFLYKEISVVFSIYSQTLFILYLPHATLHCVIYVEINYNTISYFNFLFSFLFSIFYFNFLFSIFSFYFVFILIIFYSILIIFNPIYFNSPLFLIQLYLFLF